MEEQHSAMSAIQWLGATATAHKVWLGLSGIMQYWPLGRNRMWLPPTNGIG